MTDSCVILPISAKTISELEIERENLLKTLHSETETLYNISETLLSKESKGFRIAVVASDKEEALRLLKVREATDTNKSCKVIFAFSGQGTSGAIPLDYLRSTFPMFNSYISKAEKILLNEENISIPEILTSWRQASTVEEQIFSFVFGVAMAMQYIAYGVEPDVLIGHSVGEITAAVISGILNYEEGLRFVLKRAKLMDSLEEKGTMCAIKTTKEKLSILLSKESELSLASINGLSSFVVSGSCKDILNAEKTMDRLSIKHRRLKVSIAAHSALIDPILPDIEKIRIRNIHKEKYPLYSSLSGKLLDAKELYEPSWWSRHCRETVCFANALSSIKADLNIDKALIVEFGVHRVLLSGGIEIFKNSTWLGCCSMSSYHEGKSSEYCYDRGTKETMANLWQHGINIKLRAGKEHSKI